MANMRRSTSFSSGLSSSDSDMANIILNNLPFDDSDLQDDTRNVSLGRFMTAWSQAEVVWGFIFRKFLDLHVEVGMVVFDAIGVKEQLEIVSTLGDFLKTPSERDALAKATQDLKSLSLKRNKIVHSSWGLYDGEAARYWRGLTHIHLSEIMNESPKGKSLRTERIFTVTDLANLTAYVVQTRKELEHILKSVMPEPGPHARQMAERQASKEAMRNATPDRQEQRSIPKDSI